MKRMAPDIEFPSYRFIPGKNTHPNKPGGHSFEIPEPVGQKLDLDNPKDNQLFLYGLDLFNHGYFWESHVAFEAVWNAEKRKGQAADFLKGLIKLAAAGVKELIEEPKASIGHAQRGLELFLSLDDTLFQHLPLKESIQLAESIIKAGQLPNNYQLFV